MEGAAGPPRGTGDALAGLGAGETAQKGAAQQWPDVVLEVFGEHLLIMKKDEFSCEQSNVLLAHNVASRESRALIPSSSVCTSWEERRRRSFQSSRVQRLLTKQQGTNSGRCKIVFRVVAVSRMQQSNE